MKSFLIFLLLVYQMVDGSQRPMDAMADLTNDLGVCILQILATMQDGNIVFSPYGIASVSVLLFEGASGNTALEILRVLNLPWNTLLARIGFRDMNRHLKTYFKSDGFLRGLIMSRDDVCFHTYYQKLLRLYGFEEPDRALTYPCNGFIPYSPETTTYSATTTEAVTVASPSTETTTVSTSEGETSTKPTIPEISTTPELTTLTDDNIITELTQTSQTVMLYNTTTFKSSNISDENQLNSKLPLQQDSTTDAMKTDTTNLKTEMIPLSKESLTTNEIFKNNSLDIAVNLTTIATQPTTDVLTTKLNEPLLTTEITELSKNESVTLPLEAKTMEPSASETVLVPVISSDTNSPLDFASSESVLEMIRVKPDRVNFTRSLKNANSSNISEIHHNIWKNHMKQILNKFKERNYTNLDDVLKTFENDFTFNSSEKNFSFPDDFIENLLNSSKFWGNSSEEMFSTTSSEFDDFNFLKKNFTNSKDIISSTEFFKNFNISTEFNSLFNSSESLENMNFNRSFSFFNEKLHNDFPNDSFLNSNTEFFNETSTFFNNLLGFIENTTQKLKNVMGFKTSTESLNKNVFNTTTELPKKKGEKYNKKLSGNDSAKPNVEMITPISNKITTPRPVESQITMTPILSSNNLTKSEFANELDGHNLPKKSISGENENLIPLENKEVPNNYANVISLRQSKLTSTKYNIKGIHSNKKISSPIHHKPFKNEKDNILSCNNTNDLKSPSKQTNCSLSTNKTNLLNISNLIQQNVDQSLRNYTAGERKIRSLDHDSIGNYHQIDFSTSNFDWFTVYDVRGTIRIPTFVYSAVLPYAYIDDLKSKVLEVPLDDRKYSLLLLLPTHRYGLNYLLSSLSNWPIRKIHRQLQTLSVYAIIPKFRVASHVDLKPALYSLGIKDLFHRYRADLSIMSPDARLYVRNIEQVVTIHVDKYPNAVYEVSEKFTERYFSASHPFIYFVIDKESKVSLVAGIMADPSKQQTHFL